MAQTQRYGDEHRIFLQGIMCNGILDQKAVRNLFEIAMARVEGDIPEELRERDLRAALLVKSINDELDRNKLNMKIIKISEEDRRKKQTSYVLVNRMDRSDDSTQLTRKAMVDFQPFELEFLKLLVAEIICSDDRQVEEIPALHLHNRVKTKAMRPQEAEDVLHRFIEQNWLKKDVEWIRLSSRFIAEMEPYLKEVHANDISDCRLCRTTVIRAVICEECQTSYHLYCLASKLPPEATAAKCIECKKNVPLSVGDEANGANGSSSRSGGEKRKRHAAVVSDSDSE